MQPWSGNSKCWSADQLIPGMAGAPRGMVLCRQKSWMLQTTQRHAAKLCGAVGQWRFFRTGTWNREISVRPTASKAIALSWVWGTFHNPLQLICWHNHVRNLSANLHIQFLSGWNSRPLDHLLAKWRRAECFYFQSGLGSKACSRPSLLQGSVATRTRYKLVIVG